MKITNDDGVEIEVYTADEVNSKVTEAISVKEAEFGKTKEQIEKERDEARTALGERAHEFAQFRKLSEEQVKKLDEKDRIIYENGLALSKMNEDRILSDKKVYDATVDSNIRSKAGNNEKLVSKMKDMWNVIGINAVTADEIENKTKMILGAISTTEPDLLASVAGFNGSGGWKPPTKTDNDSKSFADTDRGIALANDLGLKLKVDEKK